MRHLVLGVDSINLNIVEYKFLKNKELEMYNLSINLNIVEYK